ncbi:MAG: PAS domain-containing protein [Alphaproteobacteria bacterium]|nr:MAG: PAS domain-containing protein [Alphaproteobacteria bacterium]
MDRFFYVKRLENSADVDEPALRAVLDHWTSCKENTDIPLRKNVNPAAIVRHLPYVGMVDVLEDGKDFRFRLLGNDIGQLVGSGSSKRLLSEYPNRRGRDQMAELFKACLDYRQPVYSHGTLEHYDRAFTTFKTLCLPLSEDGQTVTTLLCATHVQSHR